LILKHYFLIFKKYNILTRKNTPVQNPKTITTIIIFNIYKTPNKTQFYVFKYNIFIKKTLYKDLLHKYYANVLFFNPILGIYA